MNTLRRIVSLAQRPTQPVPHLAFQSRRLFSITPRIHARIRRPSELGPSLGSFEEVANLPAMRKLLSNPGVVQALEEVQQLMQQEGVDPTAGPTRMQLFQLLSNAEFRKAGQKLREEVAKAGVDLGDQELLTAWKNLQKKAGGT